MKAKVTTANEKKKINNQNFNARNEFEMYADKPTCIRCIIHKDDDIMALNDVMYSFNNRYVNTSDAALVRVGRGVTDDGALVIDIVLAAKDAASAKFYQKYNKILADMLFLHFIDFKFINFEDVIKNTFDTHTEYDNTCVCSFERDILNDEMFNAICKYLIPNRDPSTIDSIRIPYSEIWYTMNDCQNNTENSTVSETTKINNNMSIIVSIFNKEDSDRFDELVFRIGDRCIVDLIADYTEQTSNGFFRTVHMTITWDIVGRSFYTTCHNFGAVKIVK